MAHEIEHDLQGAGAGPVDCLGERVAVRHGGGLIPGANLLIEEGPDLLLPAGEAEILAGERGDQVEGRRLGVSPVRVVVVCGIAHRGGFPGVGGRQHDQVDQLADGHTVEGFGLG